MTRATAAPLVFGAAVVVAAEFVVIGLVPTMTAELALTPARAGWLVTVFALASALLGPALVAATARLSAGPVLAAALLPFAGNLLLLAMPDFALALALRVLQGATLPLFMSLAGAQLAALRGTGPGIALLYVGVTLGGTLAPPAGNLAAAHLGWQAPLAAIGALAIVGVAGCLAGVRGTRTDAGKGFWKSLAGPQLLAHLLLSTLVFASLFAGFSYIAVLLGHAGLDGGTVTVALLGFGAAGLAGNWLAGRSASGTVWTSAGAALTVATMTLWIAATTGPAGMAIAIAIWGAAHAAAFVFCQIRVMAALPGAPGFAGSLNISAANIGIALGSFTGGQALALGDALGPAMAACAFALLASLCAATCRLRNVMKPSSFRNRSDTEIAPD